MSRTKEEAATIVAVRQSVEKCTVVFQVSHELARNFSMRLGEEVEMFDGPVGDRNETLEELRRLFGFHEMEGGVFKMPSDEQVILRAKQIITLLRVSATAAKVSGFAAALAALTPPPPSAPVDLNAARKRRPRLVRGSK
jgi:hypothetical protein